jgi:hypothetical protein
VTDPFARYEQGEDDPFAKYEQPSFGQQVKRTARDLLRHTVSALTLPHRAARAIGRAIGEHPADVARQSARGLAESGLATFRGVETLLQPHARPETYDRFGELQPAVEEPPIHSTLGQRLTEEIRDTYGEPESTAGKVAQVGGRIVGDVAQYAAVGKLLPTIPATASRTHRFVRAALAGAEVSGVQAAGGPENSSLGAAAQLTGSPALKRAAQSLPARVAAEVGFGAALNVGAEVLAPLLKRVQALKAKAVAQNAPAVVQDLDAIAAEAARLSVLKERTPAELQQLQALGERLRASEAELGAPARTVEQVAADSHIPEPLPADILERERRRATVPVERRAAVAVGDEFDQAARDAAAPAVAPEVASTPPSVSRAPSPIGQAVPRSPATALTGPEAVPVVPGAAAARTPKFKQFDDPDLEERYFGILDRMQAKSTEAGEGTTPWVRKEERSRQYGGSRGGAGSDVVHSGTAISGKAGRAIGRMKDDARIAAEIEAEFAARGVNHDAVLERYIGRQSPQEGADVAAERAAIQNEDEFFPGSFNPKELGAVNPRLARLLARTGVGAAGGGAAGSQVGDTPAERRRNAIIGALAGGALVGGLPEVRGRKGALRIDYGGEHLPPGREDGAPLHDLTGAGSVYPDDVYSHNAVRYYGTGEEALDRQSFAIAHSIKNKPNAHVSIYRAVPDDITTTEKIAKLERHKAYVMKHGRLPPNVEWRGTPGPQGSAYYNHISAELDRLKAQAPSTEEAAAINPGDWVTINRTYAKQHGESALRGKYKIIRKTARADELFTNGDSIHEWGYWPKGEEGAASLAAVRALAGAGLGAAGGAAVDTENRPRGALIGAVAGAGLATGAVGATGKLVRRLAPEVTDAVQRLLVPAARTVEAGRTARILRSELGTMARRNEVARAALREYRGAVSHLSPADRLAFIDAIEGGQAQPRAALQPAANTLRRVLTLARQDVQALGTGKLEHFIEDYFPHIWEDPDAAKSVIGRMLGTRPMQGPRSFLKQRTIPTTAAGIAAGLTPVTDNPLDLTLLKLREMNRYVMAQRVLKNLKDDHLLQFVPAGAEAPEGYRRINDAIGTVFGPRQGAVKLPPGANIAAADVQVPGRRVMGEYWGPEPVATVLNNHLSPGLRGNALYDAYMGLGNVLNQAQLGLSAFHLGFTSVDAATSRTALAIEQVASGHPLRALGTAASVPAAPFTTYLKGNRLLKAYLHPGSQGAEWAELADALTAGGGRVRMDTFYKNNAVEAFRKAVRERRPLGILGRALPAALELASKPIMEHVVPRQKLGVFADLARFELSRLPAGATVDDVRQVMAKVWDSVDNRMGQLVYDNLFWHKALKDLSMASVRSVGWNLGTVRELGGGLMDLAKGRLSHRGAYVVALPVTVGLAGGVLHYLYTGQVPETLKDYFYPRTGRKDADGNDERVQLPSYVKDIVAYWQRPYQTLKHKLHPAVGAVADMLENENFFGDQIRNPNDPLVQQLQQVGTYMAGQFVPFGIRNVAEERRRLQGPAAQIGPFVGILPAPRSIVRTPAQNALQESLARRSPGGATPEEQDARTNVRAIREAVRAGTIDAQSLRDSVRAGVLTHEQKQRMLHERHTPVTVLKFKQLPLNDAERVFELGSTSERELWLPVLRKKRLAARRTR